MAARRTLRRCATTRARDRRGTSRRTRAESMLRAGKRVALGNLPALRPSWRQRTQTVQRAGSVSCCSENHVGCLSSRRLGTLCLRFFVDAILPILQRRTRAARLTTDHGRAPGPRGSDGSQDSAPILRPPLTLARGGPYAPALLRRVCSRTAYLQKGTTALKQTQTIPTHAITVVSAVDLSLPSPSPL